jgi:anhydro-N-acetylmuramic acid kinase
MEDAYTVTGMMSGTSLDGVDLACCTFSRNGSVWEFRIVKAETVPYPSKLKNELEESNTWEMEKIRLLDHALGRHFALLANEFHRKHGLSPQLISSHGHTILHQPEKGITVQAGNGKTMAGLTGLMVVSDFRSEDVAQGGQGAPLVPVGDRLLFGEYDACLNLGGFANISFEDENNRRIAYDIGPANLALNWVAGLQGMDYDRDGRLAGRGRIRKELLDQLNSLGYYRQSAPKSLGREWFTEVFLPVIRHSELDTADLMATVAEHIAIQLADAVQGAGAQLVLVTGGGALNQTLMERFKNHCGKDLHIPDIGLVQFKESLVFALLGLLRILGEVNCLASVTGGRSDLSTGTINHP